MRRLMSCVFAIGSARLAGRYLCSLELLGELFEARIEARSELVSQAGLFGDLCDQILVVGVEILVQLA